MDQRVDKQINKEWANGGERVSKLSIKHGWSEVKASELYWSDDKGADYLLDSQTGARSL